MEENIKELNKFLCNLEVMTVKVQNFHWNIQGKEFFVIHAKLEEYYNELRGQIDEIAELIETKGYQPLGTMKDFLENSEIKEANNEKIKSSEILSELIKDFIILCQKANTIKQNAEKESDYVTSSMIDEYLKDYTKKLWMLNECNK